MSQSMSRVDDADDTASAAGASCRCVQPAKLDGENQIQLSDVMRARISPVATLLRACCLHSPSGYLVPQLVQETHDDDWDSHAAS